MNGFESTIVLHRPVEEVFGLLSDLENDVRWRREWADSKKTSTGPVGVGTTFRLVGAGFGGRMVVDYETIAYEPHRVAAWKALSGPLPLTFSRTLEPDERGTRVAFRYVVLEPGLLLRMFGPLVSGMGRRQLEGDYPRLLELLASGVDGRP